MPKVLSLKGNNQLSSRGEPTGGGCKRSREGVDLFASDHVRWGNKSEAKQWL